MLNYSKYVLFKTRLFYDGDRLLHRRLSRLASQANQRITLQTSMCVFFNQNKLIIYQINHHIIVNKFNK